MIYLLIYTVDTQLTLSLTNNGKYSEKEYCMLLLIAVVIHICHAVFSMKLD